MRKMLVVLLIGLVFVLNGCVAIVGNTGGEAKGSSSGVKGCRTSAMADVDFVGNLSAQAKVDGYKAIAQRVLTQAERAYLVEAVKKEGSLDQEQKDEILLLLLSNPNLRPGPNVKTDKPKCNK